MAFPLGCLYWKINVLGDIYFSVKIECLRKDFLLSSISLIRRPALRPTDIVDRSILESFVKDIGYIGSSRFLSLGNIP